MHVMFFVGWLTDSIEAVCRVGITFEIFFIIFQTLDWNVNVQHPQIRTCWFNVKKFIKKILNKNHKTDFLAASWSCFSSR